MRHYLLLAECTVVSKADVIKHMLSMPILNGRMGKWILALSEFDLRYESTKAVKGQVIIVLCRTYALDIILWWIIVQARWWYWYCYYFTSGASFEFAFRTKPMTTNNQAEYEAILKGLQLLQEVKAESIEIFGDSQLVINQLIGLYECKDDILKEYYDECQKLLEGFPLTSL